MTKFKPGENIIWNKSSTHSKTVPTPAVFIKKTTATTAKIQSGGKFHFVRLNSIQSEPLPKAEFPPESSGNPPQFKERGQKMAEIKATGKREGVERSVTVNYDLGETLQDSVELFGDAVVKSIFDAKAIIIIQDKIRREIVLGKTDEEILAGLEGFKLGVPAKRTGGGTRKTAEQKLLEDISTGKLAGDALEDLIRKVQEAMAAKK